MTDNGFNILLQVISYQLQGFGCNDFPVEKRKTEENESIIRKALGLTGSNLQPRSFKSGEFALGSIFNHVKCGNGSREAVVDENGCFAGYAQKSNVDVVKQLKKWETQIKDIPLTMEYANAILELFEDCFSTVAASDDASQKEVSLYTETKIAIAIANCLRINETEKADTDKPFVLFSLDFSGIQDFIYTITSSGALKALRARSMYLSMMTDYVSDLILEGCGLSRANLIYAGGGRAHFLLPSVQEVIKKAEQIVVEVNDFLRSNFEASLYLASGWTVADENALTSDGGKTGSFSALFAETSKIISAKKLCRYTYSELMDLNAAGISEGDRECAICGRTQHLVRWKEMDLCTPCAQMERFSSSLNSSTDVLCVVRGVAENGLPMPMVDGKACSLVAGDKALAREAIKTYVINHYDPSIPKAVRISLSVHQARTPDGRAASFEELANGSKGIRRLGVLRGDVDNLGTLFAKGFIDERKSLPYAGCTLTRYSALSSSLTWFFQKHLDDVLKTCTENHQLFPGENGNGVSVVYAGGDDVFLIGGWNDVLYAGLAVQKAFNDYTGGSITMSAGYAMFNEHTPVPIMANVAADLEEQAKLQDGKNGIALFGESNGSPDCYHWDYFRSSVLDDKLNLIENLFTTLPDKGNSFLYHVLLLFREMETRPTAISSLAYLLARHMPTKVNGATDEQIAAYSDFERKIYQWAMWAAGKGDADPKKKWESLAFQTACLIYVYLYRKRESED